MLSAGHKKMVLGKLKSFSYTSTSNKEKKRRNKKKKILEGSELITVCVLSIYVDAFRC
jgi:hypothetical protein